MASPLSGKFKLAAKDQQISIPAVSLRKLPSGEQEWISTRLHESYTWSKWCSGSGGVAMVTTVLLPAIRRMKSSENPVELFEKFQTKFAMQARIASLLTGASGFYMLYYLEAWEWYTDPEFWWLHAMTVLWVLFTIVLFVLEPLVLHRLYKEKGATNPAKTLAIAHRLHAVLLALSLLTLAVSVAGTHGWISS